MGKEIWKKRTIRMSSELWWEIMKLSKETKKSKAEVIRDILREKLNIKEEE